LGNTVEVSGKRRNLNGLHDGKPSSDGRRDRERYDRESWRRTVLKKRKRSDIYILTMRGQAGGIMIVGIHTWAKTTLAILILSTIQGAFPMRARAGQELAQVEDSSRELQEDLARVDSFLSTRNLDSLEAVADRESIKWQKRDHQSLVTYLLRVCSVLSSYDWSDESRQSLLLSRHAISALTSGELSLQEYVQFVEFLTLDPIIVDETTWKSLRLRKAQLFLEARRRLADSIDPNFDFDDRPELNVKTPPKSGVPSGISPESIKDPKLRSEYESAIARNSAKAQRYNDQYWLKKNTQRFSEETERYLVNAYERTPADVPQLEELLSEYVGNEAIRNRIIAEVREHRQK
jgi:hypothetical protein